MDLLRTKGPQVLNQLTIPKFSKIFISLLKLDNLTFAPNSDTPIREWPTAMSDLVSLPQCSEEFEHKKTYIRFIVKTLQIFDEEVVERF